MALLSLCYCNNICFSNPLSSVTDSIGVLFSHGKKQRLSLVALLAQWKELQQMESILSGSTPAAIRASVPK